MAQSKPNIWTSRYSWADNWLWCQRERTFAEWAEAALEALAVADKTPWWWCRGCSAWWPAEDSEEAEDQEESSEEEDVEISHQEGAASPVNHLHMVTCELTLQRFERPPLFSCCWEFCSVFLLVSRPSHIRQHFQRSRGIAKLYLYIDLYSSHFK